VPDKLPRAKYHDFFRFIRYVKPYIGYIILAAIGGIGKVCVPLLVPQVVRHLIDDVLLSQAMSVAQKGTEFLFWIFGMVGVFIVVYIPLTYVRHYYAGKAGHRSVFDLRADLYNHILL
jgi:ABC-type multidrug transport system fused ATPase/permease subunit